MWNWERGSKLPGRMWIHRVSLLTGISVGTTSVVVNEGGGRSAA